MTPFNDEAAILNGFVAEANDIQIKHCRKKLVYKVPAKKFLDHFATWSNVYLVFCSYYS